MPYSASCAVDLERLIAGGVVLLVAKTFFIILANMTKHYAGFNVVENVRIHLIRKLKKLSLGFFTKNRLGELNTVVHKDVDNLEAMVGHFLCVMWSDIAVALIVGAWWNKALTTRLWRGAGCTSGSTRLRRKAGAGRCEGAGGKRA
jgi:ABC-type multidrug transport system fused ATPase/permease subunit